jgi:hypothetical protein
MRIITLTEEDFHSISKARKNLMLATFIFTPLMMGLALAMPYMNTFFFNGDRHSFGMKQIMGFAMFMLPACLFLFMVIKQFKAFKRDISDGIKVSLTRSEGELVYKEKRVEFVYTNESNKRIHIRLPKDARDWSVIEFLTHSKFVLSCK